MLNDAEGPDFVPAAEAVLSTSFGVPIRVDRFEVLKGSDRSRVTRCFLVDAPNAPTSVVVKQVLGDESAASEPRSADADSAWRLLNDWTGAEFLSQVANDGSPGPRSYGGDRAAGLIVLEDLGTGKTLADLLLGVDATQAEAALMSFSATLGRMHAITIGKSDTYTSARRALGVNPATITPPRLAGDLDDGIRRFKHGCDALSVPSAAPLEDELRLVLTTMQTPGVFLAYTHGDPCPDNALYSSGAVRLVDFEFGGFGHALLDAVYGRMPFPTCWCVNRLPPEIPAKMEAAYRTELVKGCPEAADDVLFYRALVRACACWMITTTGSLLEQSLGQDAWWGIATLRQRVLMRLDAFVGVAEQFGHLEATATTAAMLAARARALWPPEVDEVPLYPAFR